MPYIVEYWCHDASGDLDCLEGRQWQTVRRMAAEAEVKVKKGDADGLVSVERVERHYWHIDGDADNEYETIWNHPDWDEMKMEWRRP